MCAIIYYTFFNVDKQIVHANYHATLKNIFTNKSTELLNTINLKNNTKNV